MYPLGGWLIPIPVFSDNTYFKICFYKCKVPYQNDFMVGHMLSCFVAVFNTRRLARKWCNKAFSGNLSGIIIGMVVFP